MRVDVHSHRDAAATQSFLDHFGIRALFHKESGVGMSQVVEPYPLYIRLSANIAERMGHSAG